MSALTDGLSRPASLSTVTFPVYRCTGLEDDSRPTYFQGKSIWKQRGIVMIVWWSFCKCGMSFRALTECKLSKLTVESWAFKKPCMSTSQEQKKLRLQRSCVLSAYRRTKLSKNRQIAKIRALHVWSNQKRSKYHLQGFWNDLLMDVTQPKHQSCVCKNLACQCRSSQLKFCLTL